MALDPWHGDRRARLRDFPSRHVPSLGRTLRDRRCAPARLPPSHSWADRRGSFAPNDVPVAGAIVTASTSKRTIRYVAERLPARP